MTITNVTDRELAVARQFEALKGVYRRDHETSQAKIEELRAEVAELKAKLAEAEKRLHMLLMPVPAKDVTALEVCKGVSEQAMEIIQLLRGTP